jgi:hypothetical protein
VNINELMQLMLMKSAGFAKSALVQPQPEARTLAAEGVEASFRAHFYEGSTSVELVAF